MIFLLTAANWQSDTAFNSHYVPFNDVKAGRSSSETYSLDEVLAGWLLRGGCCFCPCFSVPQSRQHCVGCTFE